MKRIIDQKLFIINSDLAELGINIETISNACDYVHKILDVLDHQLLSEGADRMSEMIELANLSSFVGNLLGAGMANFSQGALKRNGPHKYPDLLAVSSPAKDIEIKVALERNKPKGHLAKEGLYLTCRYVLGDENGNIDIKIRGNVVWIWELRFGYLFNEHFNISNTAGDSGKTAVVNAEGMKQLNVIYCDLNKCPYSNKGPIYKQYQKLYS